MGDCLENTMKLRLTDEMTAAYGGQKNITTTAWHGDVEVGRLDWVEYRGRASISMIVAEVQRAGVATALVRRLQSKYPDSEISWGDVVTDEGEALRQSITFTMPNEARAAPLEELARCMEKLKAYEAQSAAGATSAQVDVDDWNAQHDRMDELTRAIAELPAEIRLVKGAGCPLEVVWLARRAADFAALTQSGAPALDP